MKRATTFGILLLLIVSLPFQLLAQGCEEPSDEEGVQVVGYIQPQFVWGNIGSDSDEEMTFQFWRARFGLIGVIPYDFSYYFYTEFGPNLGGVKLLDVFITYHGFGDLVKLSIGQFKSPFSLEQLTPCHSLYTVLRSRVVTQLAGPIRDMGFLIFGQYNDLFHYRVGIMNGAGINKNDNNTGKDFVGNAFITYGPFHVGGSFRYGKMGTQNQDTKQRYGAEFQFDNDALVVQAEYIWGDDPGEVLSGGCGGPVRTAAGQKDGYFAQIIYKMENGFWPVVKYEYYDPQKSVSSDEFATLTVGFTYFFNDWTRVQVNYLLNDDKSAPDAKDDFLYVQFQVKF